ncbi:MAG TPA: BlaI/MecI/CopY family transcriptional regulator [Candidatus Saccharimonadia bacterium]|nr:BlaI/MecI/CopY family transcriptional regulator [Candidatus Saccharimonadia bacterium]
MTASENDSVALSDPQISLMRVLWTRGEASVADAAAALAAERRLAHTTVATMLTRLEKRGLVVARRDGRQLLYRARLAEHEVRRSMVSGLLSTLFGGDAKALVAHLLREDAIEPGDLERVRTLLAEREDSGG